jgi:hypothetical protein
VTSTRPGWRRPSCAGLVLDGRDQEELDGTAADRSHDRVKQLLVEGHVLVTDDRREYGLGVGHRSVGTGLEYVAEVHAFRVAAVVVPEAFVVPVLLGKLLGGPFRADPGEDLVHPLLEFLEEVAVTPVPHGAIMLAPANRRSAYRSCIIILIVLVMHRSEPGDPARPDPRSRFWNFRPGSARWSRRRWSGRSGC